MNKRILILGATGLLGKVVAKKFLEKGYQVRVLARNKSKAKEIFTNQFEIHEGDVNNQASLEKAVKGCDCIHISLAKVNEKLVVDKLLQTIKNGNTLEISYVSGATVCKENTWFEMIDAKYESENMIKNSGLRYYIFRPTWFFESITLLIRDAKAMTFGKQNNPYHWLAASDFADMLVNAYQKDEANNKTFYVHGPESMLMKDVLIKYCHNFHPEIKKVTEIPFLMMKFIGFLTGKQEIKSAVKLFQYFAKIPEMGDPSEANQILGTPNTTLEQWINKIKTQN